MVPAAMIQISCFVELSILEPRLLVCHTNGSILDAFQAAPRGRWLLIKNPAHRLLLPALGRERPARRIVIPGDGAPGRSF
jgi:hypothetical protein